MTFEERMDRLTERHEALAQSLELVAAMQRENERRIAELAAENREGFAEMRKGFAETLQFINQLARVAEAHEHRWDSLEGQ